MRQETSEVSCSFPLLASCMISPVFRGPSAWLFPSRGGYGFLAKTSFATVTAVTALGQPA